MYERFTDLVLIGSPEWFAWFAGSEQEKAAQRLVRDKTPCVVGESDETSEWRHTVVFEGSDFWGTSFEHTDEGRAQAEYVAEQWNRSLGLKLEEVREEVLNLLGQGENTMENAIDEMRNLLAHTHPHADCRTPGARSAAACKLGDTHVCLVCQLADQRAKIERLRNRLIQSEDAMNTLYSDTNDDSGVVAYLCEHPIPADPALAAEEAKNEAESRAINEAEDLRRAAAEAAGGG